MWKFDIELCNATCSSPVQSNMWDGDEEAVLRACRLHEAAAPLFCVTWLPFVLGARSVFFFVAVRTVSVLPETGRARSFV